MGKIFLLFFLTSITAATVHAQKKSLVKKHLNWGVKSGVNFSTLHNNVSSSAEYSWRTGFVAGAFFRIRTGASFMVQPEFLFSSMGGNVTDDENTTYRINYFSIPVLGRYMVNKNLAVVAGPQFDLLVSAKEMRSRSETGDISNNYKDHSIIATAGFEYWPVSEIGICARYMYGLTDITRNDGSVKHQGIQLTFAVKL